jgi:hypothetical protein
MSAIERQFISKLDQDQFPVVSRLIEESDCGVLATAFMELSPYKLFDFLREYLEVCYLRKVNPIVKINRMLSSYAHESTPQRVLWEEALSEALYDKKEQKIA